MAKKRAGGQSVPEAWIGRDVVIGVGGSGARVSGELREVSDRGVGLHYGAEQGVFSETYTRHTSQPRRR
jgi:hypothetical protein